MSHFVTQAEGLTLQLKAIARLDTLLFHDRFAHADHEMVDMMFDQSCRFAEEKLMPLAASGDIAGCRLENGRVMLPKGTPEVYQEWCELGYPMLDLPLEHDGLSLPLCVQSAVQEILDGANMAFGMLGINIRCAIKALLANASEDLVAHWLPGLISGEVSSSIVISEPQAGSDVGRIRTQATPGDHGSWTISGSKIWISYGDHDATAQILHLVLARVPSEEIGTRALGLFAVPSQKANGSVNGVQATRLEHKMGLHASPTCVLELEGAEGVLIGEAGRGLQALFVMMNGMRLAVGVQGAAVANACALQALDYARERPQGGRPDAPAKMISEHPDVKRMLLEMTATSEMIRALYMKTAAFLDLAEATGDADTLKLAELMLPISKTVGAELGFHVANQGIQVLGGYGYTNDYPIERMARDIRVAAIYEGTSGIQALDFTHRKVLADNGDTLSALLQLIHGDLINCADDNPVKAGLLPAVRSLEATLGSLLQRGQQDKTAVETGAYHFLQLNGVVIMHWLGMLLYEAATESTAYQVRLRAALCQSATGLEERAATLAKRALQPGTELTL